MKIEGKKLLLALVIPLGVGGLSAWVTRDAMEQYGGLVQPPLAPPGWIFPVVWGILFVLMGIYLALPAVGMGTDNDPWVLADPPGGRAFAAALSGVDHLCRISELRCMVSESIKTASRGFHGTLSVYCGIM